MGSPRERAVARRVRVRGASGGGSRPEATCLDAGVVRGLLGNDKRKSWADFQGDDESLSHAGRLRAERRRRFPRRQHPGAVPRGPALSTSLDIGLAAPLFQACPPASWTALGLLFLAGTGVRPGHTVPWDLRESRMAGAGCPGPVGKRQGGGRMPPGSARVHLRQK